MSCSVSVIKNKVYTYIVTKINRKWHLLGFNHVDFPQAGTQVTGGSVEPGEDAATVVVREAQEETGLNHLHLVKKLGVVMRDLAEFGLCEMQERHDFQLECVIPPEDTRISYEETPPDGAPGPVAFRFYWVGLDDDPELRAGLDELRHKLMSE